MTFARDAEMRPTETTIRITMEIARTFGLRAQPVLLPWGSATIREDNELDYDYDYDYD